MTAVRRLGKDSILYALGTFLRRIAGLLLIPIYTSALSVSEYGVLETLTVLVQTIQILMNFGLSNALLRFYADCEDEAEVFVMVRTSSILVIVFSVVLFSLTAPFLDTISYSLFQDEAFSPFIVLALWWAIGGALNEQQFAYYRAKRDARTYVIFSVTLFLILTTLNIFFVRFMKIGLFGILLGNLIAIWSLNLWLTIVFWGKGFSISHQWANKLLIFGLPFIFSRFGWLILNSADRYFLVYYRDLYEVGLYGLGYKAGLILQMAVVAPFQLAWGPFVFTRAKTDEARAKQDIARVFTYLIFIFTLIGLLMFLFSAEIIAVLGSNKFSEAVRVVPYVLVASLFNGIYYWAGTLYQLTKKVALLSGIVLCMAGLNLFLNWLWVPVWGWQGAAWATVITIGGVGLIMLLISQRIYPIPLQKDRLVKLCLAAALIIAIYLLVPLPIRLLGWLVRGIMWLLFPTLLFIIGFFEVSEIRFIKTLPKLFKQRYYQIEK